MKFTDKVFAIEIPCVLGTYDYDQAFLADILQEIENIDPKACWVSGAEKPTAYMPTNLGGNASGDASYLIYSTTTNELGTSSSTYLSTYTNCQLFTPLGKPLFINLIVHNVVRSQVAPAPWGTTNAASVGGASVRVPDTRYVVVVPEDNTKIEELMCGIETARPSISWINGKIPSEFMPMRSKGSLSNYLIYNTKTNKIVQSMRNPSLDFTNIECDSTAQFLSCLIGGGIGISPTKPDKDSRWNCKCSRCKEDAYQSPFSFECSNGCKGATSA